MDDKKPVPQLQPAPDGGDPTPGDTAARDRMLAREAYVEAFQALRRGASAGDAASQVAALGLDPASAASVVANIQRFKRDLTAAYRAADLKAAGLGALWCVGGILVTALTYAAASGGGTYLVAWGAVVFGAIQAVRGLLHTMRSATQEQLIQALSL